MRPPENQFQDYRLYGRVICTNTVETAVDTASVLDCIIFSQAGNTTEVSSVPPNSLLGRTAEVQPAGVPGVGASYDSGGRGKLGKVAAETHQVSRPSVCVNPVPPASKSSVPEPILLLSDEDGDPADPLVLPGAAQPLLKASSLRKNYFVLPGGQVFVDRKLPPPRKCPVANDRFSREYFVALHALAAAEGPFWPARTPNHKGARIPLQHCGLRVERWRYHLVGYDDAKKEILQLIEFGFPLGLSEDPQPTLESTLANHGSSYNFYTWWDDFTTDGVANGDLFGGFESSPFSAVHVSPCMTAVKKPSSRRCVFDATFGDYSLNNNTPSEQYMGQPIDFAFPKIEDFRRLVLTCGRGCYIWKRDLTRYFLQIPLDPVEYPLVCFVWRTMLYFFAGLMFGLKNSGYQAQRLTDAVVWIHQRLGLETSLGHMYRSVNYSDDIAGCEESEERANDSSNALHDLLLDLGLDESLKKNHKPSTLMPFLGVNFNTIKLQMSIPPEKVEEVREEINLWVKKTTATKRTLQQLLGKLFWVSKCVRFSRPFMGRLLTQLKTMHKLPSNKKVPLSDPCRLDLKWWCRFLRRFNGVEMMYRDVPMMLSLEQLEEMGAHVNCGDAQMMGAGSYYGDEYWSRPFPRWLQDPQVFIHLKEFWVVLVSAWIWGDKWRGKLVYIFSDNDAVVETLEKEKPKDSKMQELLREFLYVVCVKGFTPTFRKIGTKENHLADFMSRRHDPDAILQYFSKHDLRVRKLVEVPDNLFNLQSNW